MDKYPDLRPPIPAMLPRQDLFCNRKLELGITLNELKIAFEGLGLNQSALAFVTQS